MFAEYYSLLIIFILIKTIYFSSISFLSWLIERKTGNDAFDLISLYIAGIIIIYYLHFITNIYLSIFFTIASIIISALLYYLLFSNKYLSNQSSIIYSILIASIFLAVFEVFTHNSQFSINFLDNNNLKHNLFFGLALVQILLIHYFRKSRLGLFFRAGLNNQNILTLWNKHDNRSRIIIFFIISTSVFVMISAQIRTPGVTSIDIVKDILVGLIIARLVRSRTPYLIILIALVYSSFLFFFKDYISSRSPEFIGYLILLIILFVFLKRKQFREQVLST